MEHRLAQATQLSGGSRIQHALSEARQVQHIVLMLETLGQGNFTSVLGSWHYNERISQNSAKQHNASVEKMPFWAARSGCFEPAELQGTIAVDQNQPSREAMPAPSSPLRSPSQSVGRVGSSPGKQRGDDFIADAIFERLGSPTRVKDFDLQGDGRIR